MQEAKAFKTVLETYIVVHTTELRLSGKKRGSQSKKNAFLFVLRIYRIPAAILSPLTSSRFNGKDTAPLL